MANISQNVNIEMLEKLPDGTYKRKYPKTRSDSGVTFDEHLADYMQHTEDETAHGIGNKSQLETTEKGTIVGAVNELFTNVSDGKNSIASAITDKGVQAGGSDSFSLLSSKIREIEPSLNLEVGDKVVYSVQALEIDATDISKVAEILFRLGGEVRISYDLRPSTRAGTNTLQARVYLNNQPVGVERIYTSSNSGRRTFTEDLNVKVGDYMQLFVKSDYPYSTRSGEVRNFKIMVANPPIENVF